MLEYNEPRYRLLYRGKVAKKFNYAASAISSSLAISLNWKSRETRLVY